MKKDQFAVIVASFHMLLYLTWLIIFRKDEWLITVGADFFQTTAPLFSAIWLYKRYKRENKGDRHFWLFLFLGVSCYAIAMLFSMYNEIFLKVTPQFPGIANYFYILMPLFILLAFHYLVMNTKTTKIYQYIYDASIVISVATSISWAFMIKPILEQSVNLGVIYKLVYAVYPISDLALLFGLICIFNSRNFKLPPKFFFLSLFGICSFLFADTVYLYLMAHGLYKSSNPIGVFWNIGIFIIGLLSFCSNKYRVVKNPIIDKNKYQVNYFREARLWLPYVSVFILFLIMFMGEKEINSLVIGGVISITLIIFRQIFTRIYNEKLLYRLTVLNADLERKVQIRTNQLIEKNKQLEVSISEVEYLAYHDVLSSLPNRRYFETKLNKILNEATRNKTKVAVLFLDLDRFKIINDTLSHSIGDLLLQHVAKRLKSCIEEKGIICRQGGDEFIVLLPNTDQKEATLVAERILESLRNIFLIDGHELFITTSIGISIFPDHGEQVDLLIKRADVAMYAVKNRGKNNYQTFTSEMKEIFAKRLSIENGMRKAIDQNEFVIYYQPKLELATKTIVGMEALIRWNHPQMGLISPGTFIPVAEETGLINQIGNMVLQTACKQTKEWQEQGLLNLCVSVNISAIQFMQKDLFDQIKEALAVSGLESKYLELEVTESVMQNVQEATVVLQKIKGLGVKVSLDDFGSGFSSLSQIKNLPIDILKIDKSFIDDIVYSLKDQAIVKTIIELGKNLGLSIVAEGVEYEEQLEYLQKNGCDQIQGYIIDRPLPKHEFEEKIRVSKVYMC